MAQRSPPVDDETVTVDSRWSFDAAKSNRGGTNNDGPPGMTGPLGDVGVPPPRPMSWGVIGNAMPPGRNGSHAAQGSMSSIGASSEFRPSSSGSRAHIPSLASRAFFAPMSSQRLQAHRGTLPTPSRLESHPQEPEDYDEDQSQTHTNRNSLGSVLTNRHQQPPRITREDLDNMPKLPLPGSRDTERTDIAQGDGVATSGTGLIANGEHKPAQALKAPTGYRRSVRSARSDTGKYQQDTSPTLSPNSAASGFRYPGEKASPSLGMNGHHKLASQDSADDHQYLGKNWEYFTGNTIFCFGGRLQNARSRPISLATAILILLPSALFFGFSAPWLWQHVSPAVPILFAYLFLICISSFYHASVTDPGILPRNIHQFPPLEPNADPLALGPPTTDWVMVLSPVAQHGAFEIPTKYCKTCGLWRPPRCHHCRVCDNCVDTQDHHCVWLNNCVGRRNYRYFFAFVASACFLGIFLFGASIGHVVAYAHHDNISVSQSINRNRVPFAMFLYGLLAFCYPAALWGYHLFLIARGQTTREYLQSNKFQKADRHRPFNQKSWLKNWTAVLLRPRPPTYMEFKKSHKVGDQRLGSERRSKIPRQRKQNAGVEMQQFEPPQPAFQGPRGLNSTPREELNGQTRPAYA